MPWIPVCCIWMSVHQDIFTADTVLEGIRIGYFEKLLVLSEGLYTSPGQGKFFVKAYEENN